MGADEAFHCETAMASGVEGEDFKGEGGRRGEGEEMGADGVDAGGRDAEHCYA